MVDRSLRAVRDHKGQRRPLTASGKKTGIERLESAPFEISAGIRALQDWVHASARVRVSSSLKGVVVRRRCNGLRWHTATRARIYWRKDELHARFSWISGVVAYGSEAAARGARAAGRKGTVP